MYGQLLVGWHALPDPNVTFGAIGASHALRSITRYTLVGQHLLATDPQPAKDVSALGFYLSGGSTNTSIAQSIGGQISTEPLQFQEFVQDSPLPGVIIDRIANSAIGEGRMSYEMDGKDCVLRWVPYGTDATFGRTVRGDGTYGVLTAHGTGTGHAVVTVDWSSLVNGLVETQVDVRNVAPNLFPDLTPEKAASGQTVYRCIYVKNLRSVGTLSSLSIETFKSGNTGSQTAVAVDLAGVGNGTSTGVATTPLDGETSPILPFSSSTPLPSLGPGQTVAVWFRRVTSAGWHKRLAPDVHLFLLKGSF